MLNRRDLLVSTGLAVLAAVAGSSVAQAQDAFPSRPVTMVVSYEAGGPTDLMARFVAQQLSEKWGQPVIVENRPGASGTLGSDYVARSQADGYTLLMGNNAAQGTYELLNPSTTPYITLEAFAPVAMVGQSPLVAITNKDIPVNTLSEFVAWAKERPGEVNYASAAMGSATHLATEFLSAEAGLDMEMIVYAGAAPALQSIVAGETQMYMGGYSTVSGQAEAGAVKMLGVAADAPLGAAADLPTFKDQGVDISYGSWFGLMAPAAVPADILDQINVDVNEVLNDEESLVTLQGYGFERDLMDRDQFRQYLEGRIAGDAALIELAGVETN